MQMRRVLILGCCGAGKSTLARRISKITGLDIIHLDQHYWKANWIETEKTEWERKAQELANRPQWIMDGNYAGTLDLRLKRADTVIYLDQSTVKCLWRITKRILKYRGLTRPDMPEGCKERFDLEFYHYVTIFNLIRRKALLSKLNEFKTDKAVHVFCNDRQSENYLKTLAGEI